MVRLIGGGRGIKTAGSTGWQMIVASRQTGSATLDPYGRQMGLNLNLNDEQVVLVADVALGSGRPLYSCLGDWLGLLRLADYIFFLVFQVESSIEHFDKLVQQSREVVPLEVKMNGKTILPLDSSGSSEFTACTARPSGHFFLILNRFLENG
jgi:hypothetical protein